MTWEVYWGTGVWNLNRTIGWGWDITNFVWWVGIGHAGTLISAILLLFRQGWRTGVNRAAEAMTIFAVMCAGQFPIWHMGRVWMAFFVLPYPNTRGPLWVNFNSPLAWDIFAISTYGLVSLTFWYLGLLPDLATLGELGVPGVEADSWFGLLAPAGTPPAIVARINADLLRATAGEEMNRRMAELGFERAPRPLDPSRQRAEIRPPRFEAVVADHVLHLRGAQPSCDVRAAPARDDRARVEIGDAREERRDVGDDGEHLI